MLIYFVYTVLSVPVRNDDAYMVYWYGTDVRYGIKYCKDNICARFHIRYVWKLTAYMGAVFRPDFISSKVVANAIWMFITGSNLESGDEANAITALWVLNSGDKGIVLDMREMNGKTKDVAYDPFWEEFKRQLESYKTNHSRRHAGKCDLTMWNCACIDA